MAGHRKVISRKLGEYPHTKAGDARAAALETSLGNVLAESP